MTSKQSPTEADEAMDKADEANGEGDHQPEQQAPANDTEARYGEDESPA